MPKLICLLFIVICGGLYGEAIKGRVSVDLPKEIHLAKPTDTLNAVYINNTIYVTFNNK